MLVKRDASLLPQTELRKELMKRKKKPTGFWEDDMTILQTEFDREYEEELAAEDERIENQKKEKMKSEKKKSEQRIKKRELFEEEDALAKRPDIKRWMDCVRKGECANKASLRANDILSRHVLRNLPDNSPLQTLDMSRNELHDELASSFGDLLRRNKSLKKLELHENSLGARTLSAVSEALQSTNDTLTYINLDDNPLLSSLESQNSQQNDETGSDTKDHEHEDLSGIEALGSCIGSNTTLTVLSLNNCGLNHRCGKILADAVEKNDTLIVLNTDYSASSMDLVDSLRISSKLEKNKYSRSVKIQEQRLQRLALQKQKEIQDKIDEKRQIAEEEAKWIEEQRVKRCEKRKKDAEDMERKRLEEEQAKEAEQRRKDEAAKAASKKKKKKGKKKKGKKKKK